MGKSWSETLTRRDVLAAGAWAAAGFALGPALPAGAAEPVLLTKAIPSTGERLPVIGIGTNAFSESQLPALTALLRRMQQLGGKVIDTAAAYGESETVIGSALAGLGIRDQMFIATKLTNGGRVRPPPGFGGPGAGPPGGFGGPGGPGPGGPPFGRRGPELAGRASLEHSLQQLQVKAIDLLQVHNLNGVDALLPRMLQWKKAGLIRYIGLTTSNPEQHDDMVTYMKKYPVDFVEVDYSIADRSAADKVFPVALERRIAVLADVPLGGRGGGNISAVRGRPLPDWAQKAGVGSWAQLLLKYVVSHPAVTAAIPGSTQIRHLEDDQAAGRGQLLDEGQRRQLEQYWDTLA